MKRNRFLTFLLVAGIALPLTAAAQFEYEEPPTPPIKPERLVKQELFELDSRSINYRFKAALPGDNLLLIEFDKMSYYPGRDALQQIINKATEAVAAVEDSFRHATASRRVDIHLPIKDEPMTVRIKEHTDGSEMIVISNKQQAPLKIGMDTVRILKNFEERKKGDSTFVTKIQYTFLLKDARQIKELRNNTTLVDNIAAAFDTEVNKQREKWSKQDIWYHAMGISYDPQKENRDEQVKVNKIPGFARGFNTNCNMGVTLYNNTLAPYMDLGYSYRWPVNLDEYTFVRASLSAFYIFDKLPSGDVKVYGAPFINVEMGSLLNKKDTIIPVYQVSVGLGYKIEGEDTRGYKPTEGRIFRMFFNYSLSKAFTFTPEFYYRPIPGKDNDLFFGGVTLTARLF